MKRTEILVNGLPLNRLGLEIGPLHNPSVPKRGTRVLYVDHLPTNQLREKYRADGFPHCDEILEVDIVVGTAGLKEAVGDQRFAYVVASHVVEHVPNPLQWLKDIHAVLEPEGILSLAIPDKRFCFDRLRSCTNVSQWVAAWLCGQDRPAARDVLDALLNEVTFKGAITWCDEVPTAQLRHLTHPREALRVARDIHATKNYRDVHCSVFTPVSFTQMLRQLCVLELFEYSVDDFHETIGHEFFIRLRKPTAADWIEQMSSIPLLREGRFANLPRDFDARIYLEENPDVAAAKIDPAEHYLEFGRHEGRGLHAHAE